MRCYCGAKTEVGDTRAHVDGQIRFRSCLNGHRVKTLEAIVEKLDGRTRELERDTVVQLIKGGRMQKEVAYTLGIHRNKVSKYWTEYTRALGESLV